MDEKHLSTEERHNSEIYEIRLKGHLDARWAEQFEGLSLTRQSDGTTILSGPVTDQAALHGFLRKVRDLALPLVSVILMDRKQADMQDVTADAEHKNLDIKEREK